MKWRLIYEVVRQGMTGKSLLGAEFLGTGHKTRLYPMRPACAGIFEEHLLSVDILVKNSQPLSASCSICPSLHRSFSKMIVSGSITK